MANEEDKVFSANYDGIQEYDNDLPRWWVYLFYGTIVFAIAYAFYYHLGGPGLSTHQLLAIEMEAISTQKKVAEAAAPKGVDESSLLALSSNPEALAKGKVVYVGKCAACHGADGGGVVGPNLVDNYWIHGHKITDIHKTIENGVLEKGMLAWKGVIPAEEIDSVVAYIWSIRGTTPAAPKTPQGELVK